MIINKYKLTIVNGYIKSFTNDLSQEGTLWEGQASQYNKVVDGYEVGLAFGCYKLVNNEIVYDEAKCHSIIVELEAEKREREKEEQRIPAQVEWTAIKTDSLLPENFNGNELSPMAQKIKSWYQMGLWNYEMVEEAKNKGVITEEEFIEITQGNEKGE